MEQESVGDHVGVVHTILMWRIYDILLLLLMETNPEAARKAAELHQAGLFVGPMPSFKEQASDGDVDE